MVKQILKILILCLIGGFIYYCIELLWRGYSHWTMFLVGGICFIIIGKINEIFLWTTPLWKQCGIAAIIITALEFITGCIVNLGLNWNVWSYSDVPFNLLGQICPQMILAWFFLSAVGIILDDVIRWKLFGEEKPKYKLF